MELLSAHCPAMPFPLWDMLPLPNSTAVSSFLSYILDTGSYFFLIPVLFLLLHSFSYTLYTAPLSSLPSLLLSLSSSIISDKGHTTYFLLIFQEETLVPNFHGFEPSCLYILYSLHRLLLSPLWSILSQVEAPLLETCFSCYNILVPFLIWNTPVSSLAVLFVDQPHVLSAHFFSFVFLLLYLGIPIHSAQSSNI